MAAVSRTAALYEALKEELLDSKHPAGAKLGIDSVSQRFGVSAGAVREALSRLTSDRLVIALPQRGFVVAPVSRNDLIDLTEVRIEIETRCLRNSIEHGTLEWEGRLLSVWHQLSRTDQGEAAHARQDWSRLHAEFHDALLGCCESAWWLHLREQLYMQAERYRRLLLSRVKVARRDIDTEHKRILDLTLARDADGACEALRQHLQITTDMLLDADVLPMSEEGTAQNVAQTEPVET